MVKAQTTSSQLIERLNSIVGRGRHTISQFEEKQLLREAEKLYRVDAAAGSGMLGSVYALCKNLEQSVKWHNKSLTLDNYSIESMFNYISSMSSLGSFSRAKELTYSLIERYPNNPQLVYKPLLNLGHFRKALEVSETLEGEDLADLAAVLEITTMTDEDTFEFFDVLESTITTNNLVVSNYNLVVTEEVIHTTLNISCTPKEAAALNWKFSEQLARREFSDDVLQHFSVRLSAA